MAVLNVSDIVNYRVREIMSLFGRFLFALLLFLSGIACDRSHPTGTGGGRVTRERFMGTWESIEQPIGGSITFSEDFVTISHVETFKSILVQDSVYDTVYVVYEDWQIQGEKIQICEEYHSAPPKCRQHGFGFKTDTLEIRWTHIGSSDTTVDTANYLKMPARRHCKRQHNSGIY